MKIEIGCHNTFANLHYKMNDLTSHRILLDLTLQFGRDLNYLVNLNNLITIDIFFQLQNYVHD